MAKKNPFDKEHPSKIPFSELVELIGTKCDYKFCIIDDTIDDELMELAAQHNINLKGYKHVIETSGIQHSQNRHGNKSGPYTFVVRGLHVDTFHYQKQGQGEFFSFKNGFTRKKRDIVYEKDRLPIRIC